MIEAALGRNPNKWPIPEAVCMRVAEEILEARQEGSWQAIQAALDHGVLKSPVIVKARINSSLCFDEVFVYTLLDDRTEEIDTGFRAQIFTDTSFEDSETSCLLAVGIRANIAMEGQTVPLGIKTPRDILLTMVTLEDPSRSTRENIDELPRGGAWGLGERLVRLNAGETAEIYLPRAPFPNLDF